MQLYLNGLSGNQELVNPLVSQGPNAFEGSQEVVSKGQVNFKRNKVGLIGINFYYHSFLLSHFVITKNSKGGLPTINIFST